MMNTILVYLRIEIGQSSMYNFIYTRKIDKTYVNIASDRIHHEYSSG